MSEAGSTVDRKHLALVLFALLGLALALRLWGLPAELPYVYHADEPHNLALVRTMIHEGDPNPREFHYPSLFLYAQAAGQLTRGVVDDPPELDLRPDAPRKLAIGNVKATDPGAYLAGRAVTMVVSLGLVVFAFFATLRVTGRPNYAVLAGVLAAVSPLAVQHGRLITPDAYAAVFSMGAVWAALRVLRRSSTAVYLLAGALVGLAASSKYNAALAALPVVLAHFLRTGRRGLGDPRIYAAGGAAVLAFIATSPFVFLDFETFRQHFLAEVRHYRTEHAGAEGGTLGFYAGALWSKEGFAVLLALVGATLGLRRFGREAAVVAILPVTYFLFISRFPVRFDRNLLPMLGPLFVLAACGLAVIVQGLPYRFGPLRRQAVAILAIVALAAWPVARTVSDSIEARTDERAPARRWIARRVPPGATVAVEGYTPWVDPEQYRVVGLPNLLGRDLSWFRDQGIDYAVTSSGGSGRFLKQPERYAAQAARYRELVGKFEHLMEFKQDEYWARVYQVPAGSPPDA